jgi:hypothetical protein
VNTLDQMKERLQSKGWIKKTYWDNNGGACLLGAYLSTQQRSTARSSDFDSGTCLGMLADVIREHYQDRLSTVACTCTACNDAVIPTFNDAPGTCLDDVVAVLEKASVKFEETTVFLAGDVEK